MNEAKLLVSRDVAIDLPAGPSEVLVVRGRGAVDRRIVELELAAQAEHGPDSVCRAIAVDGDLEAALARDRGDRAGAPRRCSARRRRSPPRVRNAGAIFVGPHSPVAAGDYATGGNHVLPTGGWAARSAGSGSRRSSSPSRSSG